MFCKIYLLVMEGKNKLEDCGGGIDNIGQGLLIHNGWEVTTVNFTLD